MPASLIVAAVIACTAPQVHDGDTLRCGADRVRLFGVDAPEVRRGQAPAEPFAYEARDELARLTRGRVGCRVVDRDRYGRFVGRCWSDATSDLNAALIRSGFAKEYRRYSKGAYAKAEAQARAAGRGQWRTASSPRPCWAALDADASNRGVGRPCEISRAFGASDWMCRWAPQPGFVPLGLTPRASGVENAGT